MNISMHCCHVITRYHYPDILFFDHAYTLEELATKKKLFCISTEMTKINAREASMIDIITQ